MILAITDNRFNVLATRMSLWMPAFVLILGVTASHLATSAPADSSEPERRYTAANTPIGSLFDDPAAFEVLARYFPQIAHSGARSYFENMSLKGLQGYTSGLATDEALLAIDAELAKIVPPPGAVVAGPMNYDENKVRDYELPDPFLLANGDPVPDAETWWAERRPEILELYTSRVYGRSPGRPEAQRFEVTESAAPAFGGKALRTQVVIHLAEGPDAPSMNFIYYLPAGAEKPAPVLLMLGFEETTRLFGDTAISGPKTDSRIEPPPTERLLAAGFAVAGIHYTDLSPDAMFAKDGYAGSVRAWFDGVAEEDRPADAWGATAAWGWGLSRAQDYLATEEAGVDPERVALFGASRNGRAVLWAAARDQRFAAVIACCSGKPGAALLRRNFGDPLGDDDLSYNYAPNFESYVDRIDELPVDSHLLLGLIAPRAVLLQTGNHDHAADPKGEFLAAVAASPIFELLGSRGLGMSTPAWPPLANPVLNSMGYYMHKGGNGTQPGDWDVFLDFLNKHLTVNE